MGQRYETNAARVLWAYAIGLLAWTVYKFLWALRDYLYITGTYGARDFAGALWISAAFGAVIEFALCSVLAGLLWLALRRSTLDAPLLGAALGMAVFYALNAAALVLLPVVLTQDQGLARERLLPGPRSLIHIVSAGVLAILMWRVACRRVAPPRPEALASVYD